MADSEGPLAAILNGKPLYSPLSVSPNSSPSSTKLALVSSRGAPALVATGTTETTNTSAASSTDSQAASLAQREQQSRNLQDFKGGTAVVYIGSGTVLVLLIILLIVLI